MDSNNFGELLKTLRKNKKMTQEELATASGITKVSICNLEKGKNKPQAKTIAKLSKALGCDYDYLNGDIKY